MTYKELSKRYFIFLLGLFFMGLGIALTTKSNLGTSPISSLPYVVSVITPLTFGQLTFILANIWIALQFLLLGKAFPKDQYLQLLVGPFFGLFVDVGMYIFAFVDPNVYAYKLLTIVLGSAVLALGVYFQVMAKVVMNPGEAVVKVLSQKFKIEFGIMKIIFDWSLVLLASIISLMSLRMIVGIREGTLISAFLVGYIIKLISPFMVKYVPLEKWFAHGGSLRTAKKEKDSPHM